MHMYTIVVFSVVSFCNFILMDIATKERIEKAKAELMESITNKVKAFHKEYGENVNVDLKHERKLPTITTVNTAYGLYEFADDERAYEQITITLG